MAVAARVLAIFLMLTGSFSAPAWSCSCEMPDPDEFVTRIAILFDGALIGAEGVEPQQFARCRDGKRQECRRPLTGIFRIDTAYKGELGDTVRIVYSVQDGNCGTWFHVDKAVTVAAYGDPVRGYHTNLCALGPVSKDSTRAAVMGAVTRYRIRLDGFNAAILGDPGNPAPLIAKATFLVETNASAAALELLALVLAADNANRDAAMLAAKLRSERGEEELAIQALNPYLADHPDDEEAQHARMISLLRLGRLKEIPEHRRDFSRLNAERLNFSSQGLDGVSFRSAKLFRVNFANASLRRADFSDSRMNAARFDGGDLEGANFSRVRFGGSFEAVSFKNAVMKATNLSGASLAHADLTGADLRDSLIEGANLSGAKLQGADLRKASLKASNLDEANLEGAVFDEATIWPEGFDPIKAGARRE